MESRHIHLFMRSDHTGGTRSHGFSVFVACIADVDWTRLIAPFLLAPGFGSGFGEAELH